MAGSSNRTSRGRQRGRGGAPLIPRNTGRVLGVRKAKSRSGGNAMTLHRLRRIHALAICASLLTAGVGTAAGSDTDVRAHRPGNHLSAFGYGGLGPAADAGRNPTEAYYYPSGNQFA
jgi:hypothetical protein